MPNENNENNVNRFDSFNLETTAKENRDGFLKGRSIVTRTGIFEYVNGNGTIRKELRLPEEVFNQDSLETLKMIPITNKHPYAEGGFVKADNAKFVQVGHVGEEIKTDATFVSVPYTFTDKKTIDDIKSKKIKEFSCGYSCHLDMTPGVYKGEKYDAIQRKIIYNHLAGCENAKAGKRARIKLDAKDAYLKTKEETKKMPDFKKIRLDNGVEYDAEEPVIVEISNQKKKLDEFKVNFSKLEAEKDTLKEKFDEKEKELKEFKEKKLDEVEIFKKAKELNIVREVAKKTLDEKEIEKLDEMTIEDIKKMIIGKKAKVNLDDKDSVYISARFDAIAEELEKDKRTDSIDSKLYGENKDQEKTKLDSVQSRQNMIDEVENRYKGEKE